MIYYIVIMFVLGFSIYWQSRKIAFDDDYYKIISIADYENPSNLTYPFYFAILVMLWILSYGVYSVLTGDSELIRDSFDFLLLLTRGLVFMILIILKSYCGPIVLGYVVTTCIFNLISTGELELLPVFVITLKWVFSSVSQPVHVLYTLIISSFAFNSTIGLLRN